MGSIVPISFRLIVLAVLGTGTAVGSEQIPLRWKLDTGTTWHLRVTQTIETEATHGGHRDTVSIESAMELRWAVQHVDADGTMQISQAYTRFQLRSSPPDADPVTFDSSSSDAPPEELKSVARAMRPLIGLSHTIVLSPQGEIMQVTRPPEAESLLGDLPATNRWKEMLSREGMERVLRHSLGILPESAVSVGDSWISTRQATSPLGRLALETTYRYEGPRRRGERLWQQIRAATEVTVQDEETTELGDKFRTEHKAVYYFDAAAGYLAESHALHIVRSQVPYAGANIAVTSTGRVTLRISPIAGE